MEIRTAMRERTSTAVRDPKAPDVTGTPAPMAAASHPCVCNTFEDCPNGEDEQNCEGSEGDEPCVTYCFSGECIQATQMCDGVSDCPDGSDEEDCDACEYLCNNGECIPDAYVCDGEEDCNSGEDEELCSGTEAGGTGGGSPGSCVG